MRVHLRAQFVVDEEQFNIKDIDRWARINAPYILYPYLREHVFSLTARAGFEPALLPLMLLPTLKIDKTRPPDASESVATAGSP